MIRTQLLLSVIGLSLQAQDTLHTGSIAGRITSVDGPFAAAATPPSPVGAVVVDVVTPGGRRNRELADDLGNYALIGLGPGVYTLKFGQTGFLPLSLNVRVPGGTAVHVDITLERIPPILQTMRIVASEMEPRVPGTPASLGGYRPWRMSGEQMRSLPSLGSPDVIRAIGTSPHAPAGPESGGGIHMEGSSTNHTLLLLDGIPVYNAIHAGDHPSAIDPDAVEEITAYGEPRAHSGGRVAGVIEVNTLAVLPDSARAAGSVWPTGMRILTSIPFAGGSALVGVRRNFARRQDRNESESLTLRPSDAFATASVPLAGGSLTGMVFSSTDGISFDAGPRANAAGANPANHFNWTSSARALTWHDEGQAPGRSMEFRLWQSGTSVGGSWNPAGGAALALRSRFTQTGASTTLSWGSHGSLTALGTSLELLRSDYAVVNGADSTAKSFLRLRSDMGVASGFIEHSRDMGRLTATVGGRIALVKTMVRVEPRAALALQLGRGAGLAAAFARTHQYTQSLYNDESVVDAMASLEMPVVAGANGIPISSSTSGSIRLHVPVGSRMLVHASTFARSFDALVYPAASSGGPFVAGTVTTGGGKAYGVSVGFNEQFERLEMQGSYSATFVSREWSGDQRYRPSFAPTQTLLLSAGYQFGEKTLVRASSFMSALRSTSPIDGPIAWDWRDVLSSQREVSGSPQYAAGAIGTARLEPYARLDLGIRHAFAFGGALRGRGALYLNVDNVFDRQNALGLTRKSSGNGMLLLPMMPRSLSFGVRFHF